MQLYLAERLSLRSWFGSIRPYLEREPDFAAGVRFFYVDGDRLALRAANAWLSAHGIVLERLEFDAGRMFHGDGLLLWLRIYFLDMAVAQECLSRTHSYRALMDFTSREPEFASFLRKEVIPGKSIVASHGWWRAMYLIQVCAWQMSQLGSRSACFFLRRRVWMDALSDFARTAGAIRLIPYGGSGEYVDALLRMLAPDVRSLIGRARSLLRGDFRTAELSGTRPMLAIQTFGHVNLERPDEHSDLFFWQQSRHPARNLLVLFGYAQDPLDAERELQMRRHGLTPLALGYEATRLGAATVWHAPAVLRNSLRGLRALSKVLGSEESRWLAAETGLYRACVERWLRLFEAGRVKLLVTWFKYGSEHCAMARAIGCAGGALAVYQRSYEGNGTLQAAMHTDIYFAFSRDARRVEREAQSTIRCGIVTGYLGDHRFALVRPAALKTRRRLEEAGARRIAAYFDENSSDDPRWIPGHERQVAPYEFLLGKLLREPDLGLVLKPKSPRTLRRRLGPAAILLDQAVATGRCIVHDAGLIQGSTAPAQAALAADLAIHGSVSAGTAGVEAALAGVRTVLIDEDSWRISPLARLGPSVVFVDWDALWQTWHEHRSLAEGVKGFGDWGSMLDELDPFRDGKAAERMGTFLHWMLEALEAGMNRDAALEVTAARYGEQWGMDKVFSTCLDKEALGAGTAL